MKRITHDARLIGTACGSSADELILQFRLNPRAAPGSGPEATIIFHGVREPARILADIQAALTRLGGDEVVACLRASPGRYLLDLAGGALEIAAKSCLEL